MVRTGYIIYLSGWAFNLIETAYFGWNIVAQSHAEKVCDWISAGVWIVGAIVLWYGLLFDKPTSPTIKDKFLNAWRLLFSSSYQIYYTSRKEKHMYWDNITIGEAAAIAKILNDRVSEARQQERAVNEVNQILNNRQ